MGFAQLTTPITINGKSYHAVAPQKSAADRRMRTIEVYLGLGEVTPSMIRIGKEDIEGTIENPDSEKPSKSRRIVYPEPPQLPRVIIADTWPPDPDLVAVWEKYDEYMDELMSYIIARKDVPRQGITNHQFCVAEDNIPFDVTDEPRGTLVYGNTVTDNRIDNQDKPEQPTPEI